MVALGSCLAIPSPPRWLASEKTTVGYPPGRRFFFEPCAPPRLGGALDERATGFYFVGAA
jgi:hypothetical protein